MPRLAEPPRCACPKCGYDLRGIEANGYTVACPECGGEWLPSQLSALGMTLARSVRSVYVRWGVGVGFTVGIATIAAFAGALAMLVLPGERPVFAAVAAGLIFLSIPVVWGLVLRSAGRSFKRVFVAHGCDDAGPRAAQCAGWVFLMLIAMTVMLFLLVLVVL